MKWNPFVNALFAILYIVGVVLFLHNIESVRGDTPDTLLDGIGFISLFVLSVATMAFLFFYQPIQLLIERKNREALSYFLTTLAVFAVGTIAVLMLVGVQ